MEVASHACIEFGLSRLLSAKVTTETMEEN
jgi:hypothetical protein